jgi:adenylate cyclase
MTALGEDNVRAYLEARFGSSPIQRLARTMHRLTGGNALLLASAMDCLVAEDRIALVDGTWRLRHAPRTIETSLPQSLLDVMLWRFQQLGADDRATLEAAAAVGVTFLAEDVAIVLGGLPVAATAQRLDELHARGFLRRRSVTRPDTAAVYGFIHPVHADILSRNAPAFQQVQAAQRLALAKQEQQRFG